jgi:hypothetical protein
MKIVSIPVLYLAHTCKIILHFFEHFHRRMRFFVTCYVLHVMSYIYIIFTGYVEVKCV